MQPTDLDLTADKVGCTSARPRTCISPGPGEGFRISQCQAANAAPPQNAHGVNTVCFQTPDFPTMVSTVWSHEAEHLALAQEEAARPERDIYAQWEPIVRTSSSAAHKDADDIQSDVETAVRDRALSIHTPGRPTFTWLLWRHSGSGIWTWDTIKVQL